MIAAPSNAELAELVATQLRFIRDLQKRVLVLEAGHVQRPRIGPHVAGSATSRAAAIANYPRSGSQRGRVLALLEAKGDFGATRQEIARELKMSDDSVRPRVVELVEGGWIAATDRTRATPMGEQAEVLVATNRARLEREAKLEETRDSVSPEPVVAVSEAQNLPGVNTADTATTTLFDLGGPRPQTAINDDLDADAA